MATITTFESRVEALALTSGIRVQEDDCSSKFDLQSHLLPVPHCWVNEQSCPANSDAISTKHYKSIRQISIVKEIKQGLLDTYTHTSNVKGLLSWHDVRERSDKTLSCSQSGSERWVMERSITRLERAKSVFVIARQSYAKQSFRSSRAKFQKL